MFKKIIFTLFLFLAITVNSELVYTADEVETYTTLRVVDKNTFNEYRYKITDKYLDLRNKFEVEGKIDSYIAKKILAYAKEGLNYLPDSLSNKNYYNYLKSSIEKGIKYPENSSHFESIAKSIENYLNKTVIKKVSGTVESHPSTGNAPLTVTLRGNVRDPEGTKLENHNYTWWINEGGKRKIIGNKISLNYIFREEGNYSIFLDVTSNHKNSLGFTDVLPFSSRANIVVKEKIASIILKVNSESLRQKEELKFTPDEARYGLLFDATSSTPTSGTKFTKTEWDFGNGVEKTYSGSPRIERVTYAGEGEFTVKLKLKTNEGKTVERKFLLRIHNPIATINASNNQGYLGDKFTFSANPVGNQDDLNYSWKIIDTTKDEEVLSKTASTFTYSFNNKGKYNVKLFVTEPSGETDTDSKIIYINSRAPVADFTYSIPYSNKPNTVFLDATKSYDPDFLDEGKLKYEWIINGQRTTLANPNFNGSNGFYTFSSIGEQSVVLEVTDPDKITSQKKDKVDVKSILSVEFFAFPRVVQREKNVRFISDSPKARFFEWDFGDGEKKGGKEENINHIFKKSGVYNVKLKVIDDNDNENTFSKNVYIGDTNSPYAFVSLNDSKSNSVAYEKGVCNGEGAYILNRVENYKFSGEESMDITGETTGLSYSWKVGNALYNSSNFSKTFDELGCFQVKLIVKSDKNGKESVEKINVKVENMSPTLSSLDVRVKDFESDPVIATVTALGSDDKDGVIQSYLWYYYTDIDPEPQDFRATKSNSTSFVIPKVTGNYYFVVVMKDNNEARSNSEVINGSKYFITLTGDNVNTPLVSLGVDDNSVSIGDEVIFTSNVENILGQNLNNKVKYSWDFDGDGFYDKETTSNIISHKYIGSGEKHAKVKVKYKGFSNTKSLTINVANILKPDFDYISIGKDFIFFDNSLGSGADYEWDFGDGNKSSTKGSVKHIYEDGKIKHIVKLKLTEGTKIKEITKKVVKDFSNTIKAKKSGLVVFSNFEIIDDTIILKDETRKIYVYLGANSGDISNYVADFDIESDSDINGGDDDDEDNKDKNSYFSGESILIELNRDKEQKIRLYTKGINGAIIESRDIKIIKEYVEEEEIDINSIVFEGVSDSSRVKLEKIKLEVAKFGKEHKLKGLMYVQKLKEEWNDEREKTNIILEFEGFIEESQITGGNELIDLLESLLIEGDNDKSEKSIAFIALKNLIPKNIKCVDGEEGDIPLEGNTCYDILVAKLEVIGDNLNIDENKELGKQILKNIADNELMTVKEKVDFKAILNTFIYGAVSNIPDEEKETIIEVQNGDSAGDGVIGILIGILKIIFIVILVFAGVVLIFYIFYKILNKDKNKTFSEFIIEKTSGKKVDNNETKEFDDILSDELDLDLEKEEEEKIEEKIEEESIDKDEKNIDKLDTIEEETNNKDEKTEKGDVPDWLKGNFSEDFSGDALEKDDNKQIEKATEIKKDYKSKSGRKPPVVVKKNSGDIPDWLKSGFEEPKQEEEKKIEKEVKQKESKQEPVKKEEKVETIEKEEIKETKEPKLETKEELDEFTKIEEPKVEDTGDIPDWLKGSFDDSDKKEKKDEIKEKEVKQKESKQEPVKKEEKVETIEKEEIKEVKEPKLETKEELDEFTKIEEPKTEDTGDIPDWLKGSFDDSYKKEVKEEEKEVKQKELKQEPVKKEKIKEEEKKTEKKVKQKELKKEPVKKEEKVEKIEQKKPRQEPIKKETKKKTATKNKKVVDTETKQEEKIVPTKKIVEKGNEKKIDTKKPLKTEGSELWDDGMKVPDWLQTDDDK